MSEIEYKKSLIGEEDLLLGFGIVNQTRGNSTLPINKINSDTIPHNIDMSIKDKLDTIDTSLDLRNSVSRNTIADLKLENGVVFNTINVLGYHEKGDGGGGTFYWDSTSTETDNGGTIIQATGITTGRWKRVITQSVNEIMFGIIDSDVIDQTEKIKNLLKNNKSIIFTKPINIKITNKLEVLDIGNIDIDFKGSIILPYFDSIVSTMSTCLKFSNTNYDFSTYINISNLKIDYSNTSYLEKSSTTESPYGIFGINITNFATITINNYKANDIFYGSALRATKYNKLICDDLHFMKVGCKNTPYGDNVSTYDASGDAIYLGDFMGEAQSIFNNVHCESYYNQVGKIGNTGRAGIVMENFDGVYNSHKVIVNNGYFDGYHRIFHQEDGGKTTLVADNCIFKHIHNLAYNIGGLFNKCYYNIKNSECDVSGSFGYGGTYGIQNFQSDGYSTFENCNINISFSGQTRGRFNVENSTINIIGETNVTFFGLSQILDNCTIISNNANGFLTFISSNSIINNSSFNNLSTTKIIPILKTSGAAELKISNCLFNHSTYDFVNSSTNKNKFYNCDFNYSDLAISSIVGIGYNTANNFYNCNFKATGSYIDIYGDGAVNNNFKNCSFINTRLQYSNSQMNIGAVGCNFEYDDSYSHSSPFNLYGSIIAVQSCTFWDKKTAQNITVSYSGLANILKNNSGTTVI